jgi:1-acyl-sn-glycerol-3-phosphate acyltransferase
MYAPVSACGAGCLPHPDPSVRRPVALRAARLSALIGLLVAGIGLAAAMPVLTAKARAAAVQGWFRLLLQACGVRLVVHGVSDAQTAALFAANHVSWLDIPAMLAIQPARVLAKSDVRDWPVLGLLAARAGTLFIDRRRLRRLPYTVDNIATALREGHSVLVFPEGSTWCGRTQGRFYPATFQAAIDATAPVRPVSLRYRFTDGTPTTAAAFVGDDPLIASIWRVVATRGLVAEVELGGAITPSGPTRAPAARRDLCARTASAVRRTGSPAPAEPHTIDV